MTTEQDGAPSASAGGAPASKLCFAPVGQNGRGLAIRCDLPWGHPGAHHGVAGIDYGLTVRPAIPEPFRRMFWVAAEDLANVIGCTVVEGEPRGYGEPDPRDAEIERLRGKLDNSCIVVGDLCKERDEATAELERIATFVGGSAAMPGSVRSAVEAEIGRRDAKHQRAWEQAITPLVGERDRLRRELADVTADRDRWQAHYNQLIGGALAVQQHLQRAAGKPVLPSDEFDKDYSRSMVDELVAERDRLRQDLDWIAAQPQGSNPYWQLRSKRVEDERDRLRQDLDDIRSRAKAIEVDRSSKTVLLSRIQDVLNEADTKPAEPRRFYAHSPEPEVGTVVGLPDRKPGGPTWTRHPAGGWQRSNSPGYRMAWKSLFGDCGELVEVVTTDG